LRARAEQAEDVPFWYRQKVVDRLVSQKRKYNGGRSEYNFSNEYDTDDYELVRAAKLFFGNWKAAGIAAGLAQNGEKRQEERGVENAPKPSRKRLLEILSGLADAGESMAPENIVIMHNRIWQWTCGKNGYYSHWPSALKSAGIDPSGMSTEPYWTEPRLFNKILDLYESQLLLSTNYIRTNYWHLYRSGLRMFGGWKNAVDATKLGYENIIDEINSTNERQDCFQNNLFGLLRNSGRDLEWLSAKKHGLDRSTEYLGIFAIDNSDGTLYSTVPRSWWPNIEPKLTKLLSMELVRRIELYYISGEPREWRDNRIEFYSASDLIPLSCELGCDEQMRRILSLQYNIPSFL
jgi:hypothetical protein